MSPDKRHRWHSDELFLDSLGFPMERVLARAVFAIPNFFDGAFFDCVASNLSVEFPHHCCSATPGYANREENFVRFKLYIFKGHFDVLLAATASKCASQLVSLLLEFESGLIRLGLTIESVSHLPSPGGIDGWLPGSEGWAGDGQYQ